jgi:acyl-CoA synthetase (AMP-forming)/AMP-acid ligase II
MEPSVTRLSAYPPTLVHALSLRARRHGERIAIAFTDGDDRWSQLSYAELAGRAAATADLLRSVGGDPATHPRVLIALPNSIEYLVAYYGCLIAGAVAVPFYPPTSQSRRSTASFGVRLRQIQQDCAPAVVIAPASHADQIRAELSAPARVVAAEALPVGGPADRIGPIAARPSDLAMLQYTSGSTRQPRGVMVSHGNLAHNVTALAHAMGSAEGESIASWLPLFHDMGLIGSALHPLAAGMSVYLTTPVAFVRRPLLWLQMISRYRATMTFAPNFAYDLCVRWVSQDQRSTLDLSSLRAAVLGGEPVRHTTLAEFVKAYEPHGLRSGALVPGYGLAEATLYVALDDWRREPRLLPVSTARLRQDSVAVPPGPEPATVLASCGYDAPDTETVIVDPVRLTARPAGQVGEIWVTGPGVAGGYWNQPDISNPVFASELAQDGREFLRTGDLGVKVDGELFVVGRLKDTIVSRGANHSPQDVEFTAEQAHPAVRAGGTAAFAVPVGEADQVVVLCELGSYRPQEYPTILAATRNAVIHEHGLDVCAVALLRRGGIPKTTSGKVKRSACRDLWLTGGFQPLARWPEAPSAQGMQAPLAQGVQAPLAQGVQAPLAQGVQAPLAQGPEAASCTTH